MNIGLNDKSSNDSSFGQTCATIIAISSGKGGVGKTQICANLAVSIASLGKKVCIVDADHGLANINIVLGISSSVLDQNLSAESYFRHLYENFDPKPFIYSTEFGFDILPSQSGLNTSESILLKPNQEQIIQLFNQLRQSYDVILIDTAAGIDNSVKHYIAAADQTLVVINSEPTSLTDSFGLIRKMKNVSPSFEVIVNRVNGANAASKVFKRFAGAVKKYIGIRVSALGYIREDTLVSAALLCQRVLLRYSPECMASVCINRLAEKIVEQVEANPIASSSIQESLTINQNESVEPPELAEQADLKAVSGESDPGIVFDNWLAQIEQLLTTEKTNTVKHKQRVDKFMSQLEIVCDKDADFLTSLESLVVNMGINDSESEDNYDSNLRSRSNKILSRFNLSGNSFTS